MKFPVHLSTVLVASVLFAAACSADDTVVPDVVILNKYPTLNEEELKQVLFKASTPGNYNQAGVSWAFHNPFRDKSISGIVFTVEFKTAPAEKPTVLEIFVRTDCGPLQSSDGHTGFFDAEEAIKVSPTIKLKEVHYQPPNA